MPIFKSKSLSAYIFTVLACCGLLFLLLVCWILVVANWQAWNIGLALLVLSVLLLMGIMGFKHRVMSSFDRALLHIEAVKFEDYNQYAKSEFKQGVTAELHNELTMLSEKMQTHKSQYDQHALLLYQLIDQLDTPMLVFNQKQKLTYANAAFSTFFGQPWQMYRLASPKLLGLIYTDKGWHLPSKDKQWHVSQSEFIDTGERHQLLVFTNIDSAIRASQLHAWQQIIRVMGHEIRNSLTPVSSLAESLKH
jgi:two-component system nitrogen regulation sensor histidine kinase NtrY